MLQILLGYSFLYFPVYIFIFFPLKVFIEPRLVIYLVFIPTNSWILLYPVFPIVYGSLRDPHTQQTLDWDRVRGLCER